MLPATRPPTNLPSSPRLTPSREVLAALQSAPRGAGSAYGSGAPVAGGGGSPSGGPSRAAAPPRGKPSDHVVAVLQRGQLLTGEELQQLKADYELMKEAKELGPAAMRAGATRVPANVAAVLQSGQLLTAEELQELKADYETAVELEEALRAARAGASKVQPARS